MEHELTADDLAPLIAKLSTKERQRLFRIALRQDTTDAEVYAVVPVNESEFSTDDDDPLGWDADGWEDFD